MINAAMATKAGRIFWDGRCTWSASEDSEQVAFDDVDSEQVLRESCDAAGARISVKSGCPLCAMHAVQHAKVSNAAPGYNHGL